MVSKENQMSRIQRSYKECWRKKAEQWRERHGVKFEPSKYVLTHFSRSRIPPAASIKIGHATIEPANEAKYLGIIFDRKLRFTQHIQHAAKKGTRFTLTISRIHQPTSNFAS